MQLAAATMTDRSEIHYKLPLSPVTGVHGNLMIDIKKKRCPEKTFIPAPVEDETCACSECAFMKLNTLEKLYNCLRYELPEIELDSQLMAAAKAPIDRMLALG